MNTLPPRLLHRLQEQYAELPDAQRRTVDLIVRDPQGAVGATVEQLARHAGVSMPTIVRTCRSFGYESVREFMLALAQDLAVTGSYLHRSVLDDDSATDVASKIVHAAVSSLTELGRRLDVDMIDRVATRLVELGSLVDTGTTALLRGDLVGLGTAMNRAHDVLASLGVSTAQLDSLCEAARATGAYGAKLTGAGGGGAVIAIAPRDREQAILAEWKHAGITGFVSNVGG